MVNLKLTDVDASLLRDLLRYHSVKLKTDAAYVAYSSHWNARPERVLERQGERDAAERLDRIVEKLKIALADPT